LAGYRAISPELKLIALFLVNLYAYSKFNFSVLIVNFYACSKIHFAVPVVICV